MIWPNRLQTKQERRHLPDTDSTDAAKRFHQGVRGAAMAVQRQELKRLQAERRPYHDRENQQYAVGVSEREGKANQRKRDEALQMRAREGGAGCYRRKRCDDDQGERQPARDGGYSVNHDR